MAVVIHGEGELRYLIVFLVVVLTSCGIEESKLPNDPVVGLWDVDPYQDGLPDGCKSIKIHFDENGNLKMESGLQVITAEYTLENISLGEYILKQKKVSSNGKENCQNISSEFVLSHYAENLYMEVSGNSMLMHFGPSKKAPSFKLIRK